MKKLILLTIVATTAANAETYFCPATGKYYLPTSYGAINDKAIEYSSERISEWQFTVKFEWNKNGISYLSRCSFESAVQKFTCDRYEVDRIDVYDPTPGIVSPLVKAYVFRSQYNFQLVVDEMTYIEDNGRGGIQYGTCTKL